MCSPTSDKRRRVLCSYECQFGLLICTSFTATNVLQSPASSAVVTLLQKHGGASAVFNWAGLQLFGIARMM